MPRGVRKPINYDEEIMRVQGKITMHTNSLSELRSRLKELQAQKEQEGLRSLQVALQEWGKSIDEVLSTLT